MVSALLQLTRTDGLVGYIKENGQVPDLITHLDLLPQFEEEWNRIFSSSGEKSPFTTYSYTNNWYQTFASPGHVRVYRIRAGSRTIGFMPLVMEYKLGIREISNLLGTIVAVPEPPIIAGLEREFEKMLLLQLSGTSEQWDIFRYVDAFSFNHPQGFISNDLLAGSAFNWKKKKGPNYSIDLDKTFEEYLQNDLSRKVRRNLNLSRNRLNKSNNPSFVYLANEEAVQHWPMFLELENSGWKGTGGTSILKMKPKVKKYYDLVVRKMADCEILHLYLLKIDEKTVAASIGYIEGDIFHEAKSAYDEEYNYYSPSNLLRIFMIKNIRENFNGIKRINMFPIDYGYKHNFCNEHSEHIETVIYSPSPRGRIINFLVYSRNIIFKRKK